MSKVFWLSLAVAVLGGIAVATPALAAPCSSSTVRWASSSNRIYVSGAGTVCTLPEIDALLTKANLSSVAGSPDVWWLGSNILVEQGAALHILGPAVTELRLKSNNTGSATDTIFIRADWGEIVIRDTRITSWDDAASGPDTNYGNGRSYIQVKSKLSGTTPLESRMDVMNSDVGYLGYNSSEAYGLSWKVLGSGVERFNLVEVRGNVENSRVHHSYFGGFTYGALDMRWVNNELDHNVVYGLDPHDDSDGLLIEGNHVHHNGLHGIICSKRCDHITVRNNTVHDNGGNGIMLHREVTDSLVEGNEIFNHPDGGIALLEGHRNVIRTNTSRNNKYGVRLSVGSEDNTIAENSFLNNTSYGIYFYKGSDAPASGDGRPKNNEVADNTVSGNQGGGIKLFESDQNVFLRNQFLSNGQDLRFEKSHNNRFEANTVSGNPAYGVRFELGSTGNQVLDNTIENNGKVGVYIRGASNANTVSGNLIRGHLEFAVKILDSFDNTVTNNQFEGNRRGVNLTDGTNNNHISNNTTI